MALTVNLNLGDTQLILAECKKQRLTTHQTAYVLATTYWETNHTMKPVKEAYWLSEEWRKNNLRYYPWYGRGYVQLTWEDNYKKAEKKLFTDLTRNPDRAMIPSIAAQVLVMGSKEGWFTGKKLSDYIDGPKVDFLNARRIINGTDKAKNIEQIAWDYYVAIKNEPDTDVSKPKPVGKKFSWSEFFSNLFKR